MVQQILKSQKISKNHFFIEILIFWKYFFSAKKKILVLPIEEISIGPEVPSPPRFRIQGGGSLERDTAGAAVGVAGRYFPFLI